ncbi:hypothetical protein [Streptomyces sp. NPDC006415]|uniref:hypothetical protein n=1 Tax=Streptomyces sp. NPDC006415 TaxID=3155351 RepID=UPI0033BAC84E
MWTGADAHRVYRLDTLPLCPARLRDLATRAVTSCGYFDHHPGPHAWAVTDPLGDLIIERLYGEVRRLTSEDDHNAIDTDSF